MRDRIVKKIKPFYLSIGQPWSPKINDYIAFNSVGFGHLIRIIKDPMAEAFHYSRETEHFVKSHGKKIKIPDKVDFWIFKKWDDCHEITVVVRQFKGKKKHFFSIY